MHPSLGGMRQGQPWRLLFEDALSLFVQRNAESRVGNASGLGHQAVVSLVAKLRHIGTAVVDSTQGTVLMSALTPILAKSA